ncbi:MAG: phage tail tape measure protein [Chitinophagaceae bacterium]|nr:phage tail tape measure protein [Chitinophagaceae bacterium]
MVTSKLTMLIDMSTKLFNSGLGKMQNKWNQTLDKMDSKFGHVLNRIPKMGGMIERLRMPLLGLATAAAGFMGKATMMASDWKKSMAEINVTAELSQDELGKLSNKLLDIGTRNVAPLEEVPKAFGRIISAGLDVNQSMEALEPTLRAAKAGFTDIETVASAGIATMMSSGRDINEVYDILFETVKEGNAEFADVARYLPKVIPLARSLGYELEGTAGAFASLTTKLNTMQSTTALEGIYRSLANSNVAIGQIDKKTGQYVSGFRALGINVFDSAGKIKPLIEIVGDLNKQFDGLTDEQRIQKMTQLGFDQSAALGFNTLMQDMDGLQKATAATSNAQGALNKAYMDSLTPTEQWGEIMNLGRASMIKLGEKALPLVRSALEKIKPLFQWLYENFDTVSTILGTLAIAIGVVTAATWAWNLALAANPIGILIVLIAGLIALIYSAVKKFDSWGAAVLYMLGPIGQLINIIKSLYDHWESIKEAFKTDGIIGGLKRLGLVLLDAVLKPIQQILEGLSGLPDALGGSWIRSSLDKLKAFRESHNLVTPGEIEAKIKPEEKEKKSLYDADAAFGNYNKNNTETTDGGNEKLAKDVNKVAGDARQVKNITINIDALNKGGINMSATTQGMSKQEVEDWFNNMMMRIMRNAELS